MAGQPPEPLYVYYYALPVTVSGWGISAQVSTASQLNIQWFFKSGFPLADMHVGFSFRNQQPIQTAAITFPVPWLQFALPSMCKSQVRGGE